MSDYHDYHENLAFPPKSADDLNEQRRQSDVLVSALEKCEKLEKQLKIAVKALDKIVNYNSVAEQVDKYHHIVIDVREIGKEALAKIKEIK